MTRHIQNMFAMITEGKKMDEFTALEFGEKVCMAFAKDSNTNEVTREFARACLEMPVAWHALRDGFEHMTFEAALAEKQALSSTQQVASDVLQQFPSTGPMGMTSDAVKASPEYKAAQMCYRVANDAMRKYNSFFTKAYAKQYRTWRLNKRKGS